ncbi:MAG: aminoacyl-tRNA hydrolase [Clostridia bacterium]|nr:aminoacyl-tRNA hydrolase [Clostridia bacterium]
MAFFKKKTPAPPPVSGKPEFIVAGLGNPGKQYEYSRHNTGFLCMDVLSNTYRCPVTRLRFHALTGLADVNGHICLFMKPQTFMNLSGNAVGEAAAFYKIPSEKVLVIYDDISLSTGRLRIREKGSAGGHNGIKSIIYQLNSDVFPRIKIGVGERADPDEDLKDHVLESFSKDELQVIRDACGRAAEAVALIVDGKTAEAMNKYNG